MAKFVSELILALLLTSLSEWKLSLVAEATTVAACGYTSNYTVLLLSCTPHPGDLPIKVVTERGLTVSLMGTSVTLNNATQVTLEPPQNFHGMTLDVEVKNCGLSGLLLLPEVAESPHLLLNLSGLRLRLGDQDQFANCGSVAALNLSRNRIHEVPTNAFDGMSGLLVLDLSQNLIEHLDNFTFCQLTSLRWLDIRDNPMLMTFALTKLPALESLDASMSVLEVGVFCRMSNLRRLALHQTVDQLQCFVFDNLPSLRDLSFSYFVGSNSICFTMMCDPHPVLGGRVPFNFRITRLNSDGSVAKISSNNFITKLKYTLYVKLCKANYDNYLIHHDNNMPLTTGCLTYENDSVRCLPFNSLELCQLSTPVSPVHVVPSTATIEDHNDSVKILNDNSPRRSELMSSFYNTVRTTQPASVAAETVKCQTDRLVELEAAIVNQGRVLIVMCTVNGVFLLGTLLLLVWCQLSRNSKPTGVRCGPYQPTLPPLAPTLDPTLQLNGVAGINEVLE